MHSAENDALAAHGGNGKAAYYHRIAARRACSRYVAGKLDKESSFLWQNKSEKSKYTAFSTF